MLRRPDVFHAAIAGAPVTEWRLYDTHYTERYLGDPNEQPDVYDANSLLPLADRLARPLLLIHGLADDNVVAAHTLQLSSALLAAGKPHEVLPLVGVTHMTPQEIVAENLLLHQLDFLRRSLGLATADARPAPALGCVAMNDRLHELYHGVAVHATADLEHTAALELLALVMAADRTPRSGRDRRNPRHLRRLARRRLHVRQVPRPSDRPGPGGDRQRRGESS